jgi:aminoglycoside phosphotransferase (APT) family kinase protein
MAHHHLGLPRVVRVDEIGWVNPCIFVNDAYVFRFNARDPKLPKYQREKFAFDRLRENGVPVPRQVILDDSKSLLPYDVLITNLLPGRNLEADWSALETPLKDRLATEAGQILQEIHKVKLPAFGEIGGRGPLPKSASWFAYLQAKLSMHLREASELHVFDEDSNLLFVQKLNLRESLMAEITSAKLIHVDYHFGNLLYHDEKITGVFDFEWALAGDPLYDLCRWVGDEEEWDGSRVPFLKGYGIENFRPPEAERIKIYQMIRNIELCVVAQLHFEESEATAFRETTLAQASKL